MDPAAPDESRARLRRARRTLFITLTLGALLYVASSVRMIQTCSCGARVTPFQYLAGHHR